MSEPQRPDWQALLSESAACLAERLRRGEVPRPDRALARALLAKAFEAIEAGVAGPALLRVVDAQASPVPPLRLRPRRIGVPLLRGAVDQRLVDRLEGYAAPAERLSARIDRFLAVTGAEPLRLFIAEVRPGDRQSPEMPLTTG